TGQAALANRSPGPGVARSTDRKAMRGPLGNLSPSPGQTQVFVVSAKNEAGLPAAFVPQKKPIVAVVGSRPSWIAMVFRGIDDSVRRDAALVATKVSPNSQSERPAPRSTE